MPGEDEWNRDFTQYLFDIIDAKYTPTITQRALLTDYIFSRSKMKLTEKSDNSLHLFSTFIRSIELPSTRSFSGSNDNLVLHAGCLQHRTAMSNQHRLDIPGDAYKKACIRPFFWCSNILRTFQEFVRTVRFFQHYILVFLYPFPPLIV